MMIEFAQNAHIRINIFMSNISNAMTQKLTKRM